MLGAALMALAILLLAAAVYSFVDPAGAKMADDNDPFGPASRADAAGPLIVGLASGALGWWLLRRR
jgi:uncharacterized membrane protein YfcA